MTERFHRTRLLLGDAGEERLRQAAVAVIGLGGVGSYAAEAVARAGVGRLLLVDADCVDVSNINRQLYALDDTVGRAKVEVARERIGRINPDADIDARQVFVRANNLDLLALDPSWHVIDAIDVLSSKIALLRYLCERNIPCMSSMGAGRRLDPTRIRVADISQTKGCPLAREIRRQLRDLGIVSGISCVYSDEPPRAAQLTSALAEAEDMPRRKAPLGSISYLPALFGLTAAGCVIQSILSGDSAS